MNKVIISGNLTRDPDIRYTQSGKAVARMGIAVSRRFKSQDGSQPDVDFFNMTAWDKQAEFCGKYFSKGSRVIVEGRMQNYSYEDRDGNRRSGMEIQVENIEFGGNKRDSEFSGSKRDSDFGDRSYGDSPKKNGGDGFDDSEDFGGKEIEDDSVPF